MYVMRQASRRSWRIGQTHPVKVVFMSYRNTVQALEVSPPHLENPSKVVSTYINRRRVALSHPRKLVVYTGGQAKYLDYANDYTSKS